MTPLTQTIHPFVEALRRKFPADSFTNAQELWYPPEKPQCASIQVPSRLFEDASDWIFNALDFFLKKYDPKTGAAIVLTLYGERRRKPSPSIPRHPRELVYHSIKAECAPAAELFVLEAQVQQMIYELRGLTAYCIESPRYGCAHETIEGLAKLLAIAEPEESRVQ